MTTEESDQRRADEVSETASSADPGASAAPSPSSEIVARLSEALATAGLDLVHAFDAQRYNAAVQGHPSLSPLFCFGRTSALAVVVANSRALWPRFLAALRETPALRASADPLDDYVEASIRSAVAGLAFRHELHFASERQQPRVSMLHAADASGFARSSPMHLAVHRTLGPWFGLRALLTFDVDAAVPSVQQAAPCAACSEPCLAPLQDALAEYHRSGAASVRSSWRPWLLVRDACPIGREHRYDAEQIHYHYTKDRSRLLSLL